MTGVDGLQVLAVDDEPPALADLLWLLRHDPGVREVQGAVSAPAALRLLESEAFDAVFLDVRMPGLDGLDLARLLGRFHRPPAVVFVSAYDDFAVDAFELRAVDYLRKPVDRARLAEALRRAAPTPERVPVPAADVVIPVELGGVTEFVRRSDVLWVEAHGDYARLHTGTHNHLVRISLVALEEQWADAGFVRVHRGLLVALDRVEQLRVASGRTTVRIDGAVLTVSRRHTAALRQRLGLSRQRPA